MARIEAYETGLAARPAGFLPDAPPDERARPRPGVAARLAIRMVRAYQAHAPARLRGACRFEPTCSEYMAGALAKYGLVRGGGRGLARIARCHPPHGGVDHP